MLNSNTFPEGPLWPSGVARPHNGLLEITTVEGIRVAARTSSRSLSHHRAPDVSRSGSAIGPGSTGLGPATGWRPSTRRRCGGSPTPWRR